MRYFLGADVGATKTHVLVADETGRALGFGQSGPGNHENVGYDGFWQALCAAAEQALAAAGLGPQDIAGAGFGVAGLDWPSEDAPVLSVISRLGLSAPVAAVNDTLIGLLAGSEAGWGVAIVAGTGCNCRGWDRARAREGRVTGGSLQMGEGAGASELMHRVAQALAHAWTGRGPATSLAATFVEYTRSRDLPDLLESLMDGRVALPAQAAPLVFAAAHAGDRVARDAIRWAGVELGAMAATVARQLEFEALAFDVVLVGSLFNGGALLTDPLEEVVRAAAPQARFVRLAIPPVVGAVLLGLEQAGLQPTPAVRAALAETAAEMAVRP